MYLFLHVKYEQRSESVSSHIKTLELRKKSNSTANAFVTVTYSYEMESKGFAQLFSYPCNGLNPAAGFWRFFFIDSRNWSYILVDR